MNYILQNSTNSNRFIMADHRKPVEITNKIEKATVFPSLEHAENFVSNQLPKRIRGVWIPIETEKKFTGQTQEKLHANLNYSYNSFFDWEEVVASVQNSFSKLLEYKSDLTAELSRINEELCDCVHACEFYKLDAAKGYKIYKMIRERRVRRRFLKDELAKISCILEMPHVELIGGKLQEKFRSIENQHYEPRVLKELFEDDLREELL